MPNDNPSPTICEPGSLIPLAKWFACRRDYIHGVYSSVVKAAKAHGINPHSATTRSKREHWGQARHAHFAKLNAQLDATPEPIQPQPAPEPQPKPAVPADVQRITDQLDRLNNLLDVETDPRSIEKLSLAITRLHERRRIMLGIPLPGSQRPSRKPSRPVASRELHVIEPPAA